MELADSIAGDGHKLLNVPYDCGFILSKSRENAEQVFQNANAAYLGSDKGPAPAIASPLNIGIENSRRFRALPVYATLLAYGRAGHRDMLERQIRLARRLADFIDSHEAYELLPRSTPRTVYIIVLFRAKQDDLNGELAKKINSAGKMYVSGTVWEGEQACRIAISNWKVDVERDFQLVRQVLDNVASIS